MTEEQAASNTELDGIEKLSDDETEELSPSLSAQLDEIERELLGEAGDSQGSSEPGADTVEASEAGEMDDSESEGTDGEADQAEQGETIEEPKQIDYDVDIPLPGGLEPIKLGEMKDRYMEHERNLQANIDRENELMQDKIAFNNMVQMLGDVPPEVRERAKALYDRQMRQEFELLRESIPELKESKDNGAAFFKGMTDIGTAYGFRPEEISMISDHRIFKALYDLGRYRERLSTAGENLKKINDKPKVKPGNTRFSKRSESQRIQDRATRPGASRDDKLAAIDQLIN